MHSFTFYREQGGARLADAFLAEFERVATLFVSNPDFGTPSSGGLENHSEFNEAPYLDVAGGSHAQPTYDIWLRSSPATTG